jgi:protein-L-isoaspartate O-methyltransferase
MNILKFSLISLFSIAAIASAQDSTWYFQETKVGGWSLSADFINDLAKKFHKDVFIESGTSYGGTVKIAKDIFKEVYSVELDASLAQRAQALLRRFRCSI